MATLAPVTSFLGEDEPVALKPVKSFLTEEEVAPVDEGPLAPVTSFLDDDQEQQDQQPTLEEAVIDIKTLHPGSHS